MNNVARSPLSASLVMGVAFNASPALALDGNPSNYESLLPTLKPGDTLNLAPGTYTGGLNINALNGTEEAPIVIVGPSDHSAVFEGNGCCNTVEIVNSSYVAVRSIKVDGKNIDGVFGVSAKNSSNNNVHHITVEDCLFVGQNASQQTVGISTKTPTFGWIIRRNVIEGAGTGLYLGNSNYDEPFVGGLIEHNLIKDTIGYGMQIKNQNPWPNHPALPAADSKTIIRHNVFIKNDQPSPDGVRPNLFIGSPPQSGVGSGSITEVYGNVFYHNSHDEGLVQATGRVSIHDNLFIDASDEALLLQTHDGFPLVYATVYNNTIYGAKRGIVFGSAASEKGLVFGNLVFADSPIEGSPGSQENNIVGAIADAAQYVSAPGTTLGQIDFYPLPDKVTGTSLNFADVQSDTAVMCDFNGAPKGEGIFRGAYAGQGDNPGFQVAAEIKPAPLNCASNGGGGGAGAGGNTGTGGNGGQLTGGTAGSQNEGGNGSSNGGGCACRAGSAPYAEGFWFGWIAFMVGIGRRKRGFYKPQTPNT
ncbi:MAG: right-handed parallel beta-helix repeat-containing protein [Polyangiaceae bacterium]|nr:right-handed parallel beta-helix repeat-containing protein [Polyangiaceae bacterium]